ncbi:MAG: hypothetical protein IIA65_04335 [Planctomycetes bacterium]|nr:hypothetical protein [Planctomycetota bacterium]
MNEVVLKTLGTLFFVAAALKGYHLMSQPTANQDLWSYRLFSVFQVELELVMAIWLWSNVFRRAVWLAAFACFWVFSAFTFYRALSGAASCGCFGPLSINPWLALTLIDLPALAALAAIRPRNLVRDAHAYALDLCHAVRQLGSVSPHKCFVRASKVRDADRSLASPALRRTLLVTLLALTVTTPILAWVKAPRVTASYEVLEPSQWIGGTLPILEQIDIADRLRRGRWLVLLYHHDCLDCKAILPQYRRLAADMKENGTLLRVALIEISPYGDEQPLVGAVCATGRLSDAKRWLVRTPVALGLVEGRVARVFSDGRVDSIDLLFMGPETKGGDRD